RGLSNTKPRPAPLIIQRLDANFVEALLNELGEENGVMTVVQSAIQKDSEGSYGLFQPVHRVFHLALLEVSCDTFGEPRLDPRKIESAGLVVRRVTRANVELTARQGAGLQYWGAEQLEGWMKSEHKLRGWVRLNYEAHDPIPAHRPLGLRSGNDALDLAYVKKRPLATDLLLTEHEAPLFIAPPHICQQTGKTILYGSIPVTSSEQAEEPDLSVFDTIEGAVLNEHLPIFLRAGGDRRPPEAIRALKVSLATLESATISDITRRQLVEFITTLRQMHSEFDAFGTSTTSRALLSLLNQIKFNDAALDEQTPQQLGDYLHHASAIFLHGERGKTIVIPPAWPTLTQAQSEAIKRAVIHLLKQRFAAIGGQGKRFDDPDSTYCLRAFVRLKSEDGCPPHIYWSEYSEPFKIKPWYAPSIAPPTRVQLPNPFDKNLLNRLKPDVAFNVPKELFDLLNVGNPKDLMDGKGGKASSWTVDWICSFSIPLITICAFIVLYIFLSLFNIFFHWMFVIKICIPFPRKK
ncbi:MAG TPA: hypothetical protein VFZ34_13210, partial [Blastocatellia bacterium]|nr:hypothetical protein [Blastocatellia bacterium]